MNILLAPVVKEVDCILWQKEETIRSKYCMPEPVWFKYKHPFIHFFLYGFRQVPTDSTLATEDFYEAILLLEERYVIDYIIHLPKGVLFDSNALYQKILQFSPNQVGKDFPDSLSFIYHQKKFYSFSFGVSMQGKNKEAIDRFYENHPIISTDRPVNAYLETPPWQIISIGGWCGPASAIGINILNIRREALPFDYVNSNMQAVLEVTAGDLEAFYKIGTLIITPHCKWVEADNKPTMDQRLRRYIKKLRAPKPILFIRGIIHVDYRKAFQEIEAFISLLKEKYGRQQDRFLLVLHDQGIGTVKLKMLQKNIMLWAVEGAVAWDAADGGNINHNYAKIIEYCMVESNWIHDEQQIKKHELKQHQSFKQECQQLYSDFQKP